MTNSDEALSVKTVKQYSFNNLILQKPSKSDTDNIYVSKIAIINEDNDLNHNLVVQTPKIKINRLDKLLVAEINDDIEALLTDFDDKISLLVSENSSSFFEEVITPEESDEMYKGSFKKSRKMTKMNLNLSSELRIYNKQKQELSQSDLVADNTIICLIKCTKIIFYRSHYVPYWEVFQIKLKPEPKITTETNKYLFVDDPNDTYSDEFENIKTLKMKEP